MGNEEKKLHELGIKLVSEDLLNNPDLTREEQARVAGTSIRTVFRRAEILRTNGEEKRDSGRPLKPVNKEALQTENTRAQQAEKAGVSPRTLYRRLRASNADARTRGRRKK